VEPNEIFELIVKADEAIKYATADRAGTRTRQARELLDRAQAEARAIGNQGLVDQAQQRIDDLDALSPPGETGG
jgi:hypothetical protein